MLDTILVALSLLSLDVARTGDAAWYSTRGLSIAAQLVQPSAELSVGDLVRDRTQALVGAPFALSPLGEGDLAREDHDPRLRFDAFDCTTFVETALALLTSSSPTAVRGELDLIRYRGVPSFVNRRHFPEQEWLPDLIAEGRLRDVTRELGGPQVVRRTKHLDERVWARRRYAGELSLPPGRLPRGDAAIDVLPIDEARQRASRWPSGVLINVVRVDGAGVPVIVAHQGILLRIDGSSLVVRHAAFPPLGRVIDEPIDAFLSRIGHLKSYAVDGVNLCEIVRPPSASTPPSSAPGPRAFP